MLIGLSARNAKRQSREYLLYFITLACSVSFIYAFNTLIFSDLIADLPDLEILPYMIIVTSILIVLIMGWIIGYMTNYMLKRRSRELSIYMLSGISNRSISTLVLFENILIGAIAFVLGLPVGIFLSQLLDAIIANMFKTTYRLTFSFSLYAAGLSLIYFFFMLLYAIRKNRKWIRKASLYDLLNYDRQTEKAMLSKGKSSAVVFTLSILAACVGSMLLYTTPLGNGYDVLIGLVCLILFIAGFFQSISSFFATWFADRITWKYRKEHLILFRWFTAKIHSMSTSMGILSILLMLSMFFMGIGASAYRIINENQQGVFDIMILHKGEIIDFSSYEGMLGQKFSLSASYSYGIYTDTNDDFLQTRNNVMEQSGYSSSIMLAEYQSDTYMKQSDYQALRNMLGYEQIDMNPSLCYVHCLSPLKDAFETLIAANKNLNCEGYAFAENGVFCEPFCQMDTYGNGYDYIIVVPDVAVNHMDVLYSLWAALTETPLSTQDLQAMTKICPDLEQLNRNVIYSASGDYTTALIDNDIDYLSGRWMNSEGVTQIYAISICLFYLALVFEIIGAAILVTQLLSDRVKEQKKNQVLRQLGMDSKVITKLNRRQVTLAFILPLIPALIISSSLVSICAEKMQRNAFHLPVFENGFWFIQSFGIAMIFFLLLYCIYYCAALFGSVKPSQNNF